MTAAQIIADAQSLTRNNLGPSPAETIVWLNRIQRGYSKKDDYPELKVFGATVTTTANQGYANLAAAFQRFIGKTVLYDPTAITGGYQNGTPIPVLSSGAGPLDSLIAAWRPLGAGTPVAVTVAGADGAKKLYLHPMPDATGTTIVYDYMRDPTALAATSESPELQILADVFVNALAVQFCVYANDERLPYFRAEERREYNLVKANLLAT
jgi:hypothetical protein